LSADDEAAPAARFPIDALGPMVTTPTGRAQLLRRIDGFITLADGAGPNIDRTRLLIGEGCIPVLYANHQSHADKLVLSGITDSLARRDCVDRVTDFLVPVAVTIESGAQGAYIQRLMSLFEPLYLDRGYGPDPPDPGRNEIVPEVMAGIARGGPVEPIVTVSPGGPFTYADLKDELGEEPDPKQQTHLDLMMSKVAQLLPAGERGRY
jgi:hypothetical protein